jgi:hypothetical protein
MSAPTRKEIQPGRLEKLINQNGGGWQIEGKTTRVDDDRDQDRTKKENNILL